MNKATVVILFAVLAVVLALFALGAQGLTLGTFRLNSVQILALADIVLAIAVVITVT